MDLSNKTKEQLIVEIADLRQRIVELEAGSVDGETNRAREEHTVSFVKELFSSNFLECLPGIFYLYSYPDLRLVFWNKNHETRFGYTSDELKNKSILDWHPQALHDKALSAIESVMHSGSSTIESPLVNKKGESIPYLLTGVRYEENGKKYLMGFGVDISDRKKAQKSLQERETLYRLIAENSTDMISKHDEAGKYIYASPSCFQLLGYQPEELLGHSAFEFFHPEDIARIEDSRISIVEQPVISTISYRIRRKDGSYIWFETKSKTMRDPQSGKVLELHCSSRDITNRKNVELRLLESESKWNALFGAMTEMVVLHELVFDDNGIPIDYRITDCNNAFTQVTGIPKESAVGMLATEVYQQPHAPYLKEYKSVALSGEPYEYTTYYPPMDKHFMISVVSPAKNKFATITTDITDIKQIQESIIEKNKELENYLYVASHDLRSPLVNIQGFSLRFQKQLAAISELLNTVEFAQETKEKLAKITDIDIPKTLNFIYSSVGKMDNLIKGLLQISRTGRIKMTITNIDMNTLLHSVVDAHKFQLTDSQASVAIGDLPECFGDVNQLNQLFSNVLTNAIKYRDTNRKLEIAISAKKQYNKVVYKVSDTGMGIAPRHLERIWDVFFQVDGSSSDSSGEGLGLSIAKRIVDKHKGRIWVESEEGVGTTFYIELRSKVFAE